MSLTSHEKVLKSDRIHQQPGRKLSVVLKLFNMQQTHDHVSVLTFIGIKSHKNELMLEIRGEVDMTLDHNMIFKVSENMQKTLV